MKRPRGGGVGRRRLTRSLLQNPHNRGAQTSLLPVAKSKSAAATAAKKTSQYGVAIAKTGLFAAAAAAEREVCFLLTR